MLLKLDYEIVVEKPVNVVFEAFAEEMWGVMSGGVRTSVLGLTGGPMATGSLYIHVAEHKSGRLVESKIVIEAFEPNRCVKLTWSAGERGRWKWLFGGAGFGNLAYSPPWGEKGSRLDVEFSRHDAGTRIHASSEHHLTGALVPLSFFMRWPAHRRINRNLLRFKESVEERHTTR